MAFILKHYLFYKCQSCPRSFFNKIHLEQHISNVHEGGDKSWICDKCGFSYASKDNLQKHKLTQHAKKSPFRCVKCKKSFKSQAGLYHHNNKIHKGINWVYAKIFYKILKEELVLKSERKRYEFQTVKFIFTFYSSKASKYCYLLKSNLS